MLTFGAQARCQSTILVGHQILTHPSLQVLTPEFGDSVRARVQVLNIVLAHLMVFWSSKCPVDATPFVQVLRLAPQLGHRA